jgi:hypothetical protein
MMLDFELIWSELEREAVLSGKGLVRRRLTRDYDDGLYLGMDGASRARVFLVELGKAEVALSSLPRWREVRVRTVRDDSGSLTYFIVIELANPDYRSVFTAFAHDLYSTLTPLKRGPSLLRTLTNQLLKWQSFFREYGPAGLSVEFQRGLFGELWVLRNLVLPDLAGSDGVRAWKGPERQPHDFHLPGGFLEVKVNGKSDWDRIMVSNEEQLDETGAAPLFLFVLTVEVESPGGVSLPSLVGDIRSALATDPDGLAAFERKLIEDGYLGVHEIEYSTVYLVIERSLYAVIDGFPRIVHPSKGVSRVRYELSLVACRPFRIDPVPALSNLVRGG